MRTVKQIIIHCADTPTGKQFTVKDIDSWHLERGFHRKEADRINFNPDLFAIGYHFVIYLDGSVHTGRQIKEIGAHVSGMNSTSIGICLIGCGKYTLEQWEALTTLIDNLQLTYPAAVIMGHYQTPTGTAQGKECPSFDVPAWLAAGMQPAPDHVC